MPKDKNTPQEVVVDDVEDKNVKPSGEVEVDLDEKEPVKKEEPKYVTVDELEKIRKQLNGVSSTLRHVKDIPSQIEEIKQSIQASKSMTRQEKQEAKDELDELVEQGNWKEAVNRLAEQKTQQILREREEAQFRESSQKEAISRLEESKKRVLERYPELNDGESELAQKYIKVRNENPHFNRNELGPELAMWKMEEELRSEGRLDEFTKKIVDKEILRQTRAGASKPGTPTRSGEGKIVLTKEQREFCDNAGIKYESYARQLKNFSGGRSVEVHDA